MRKRLVGFALIFLSLVFEFPAYADEEVWVLCQPDSYVNVRTKPKTNAEISGRLYAGDFVIWDGIQRNGYCHVTGIASEAGDGWVSRGFLVHSKPVADGHEYRVEANGRVACRRGVDGTRRKWLKNEDILTVYMRSDEWCLTNQGFVKTAFIDLSRPVDVHTNASPDGLIWEEDA